MYLDWFAVDVGLCLKSMDNGLLVVQFRVGIGEGVSLSNKLQEIPLGKGELLIEGGDVLLLPVGNRVYAALEAAEGLKKVGVEAAVINPRFIYPLDAELILEWARKKRPLPKKILKRLK